MKKTIAIIALISQALALGGCTSGIMSPDDGNPTMAQTYDTALNGQTTFAPNNDSNQSSNNSVVMPANNGALPSAMINVKAEPMASTLDSQFPTLPNPQSVMYIFGHYASGEQLPVPGHFTAFPLYTETHYALPTEIQRPYNDGQFVGAN